MSTKRQLQRQDPKATLIRMTLSGGDDKMLPHYHHLTQR